MIKQCKELYESYSYIGSNKKSNGDNVSPCRTLIIHMIYPYIIISFLIQGFPIVYSCPINILRNYICPKLLSRVVKWLMS